MRGSKYDNIQGAMVDIFRKNITDNDVFIGPRFDGKNFKNNSQISVSLDNSYTKETFLFVVSFEVVVRALDSDVADALAYRVIEDIPSSCEYPFQYIEANNLPIPFASPDDNYEYRLITIEAQAVPKA